MIKFSPVYALSPFHLNTNNLMRLYKHIVSPFSGTMKMKVEQVKFAFSKASMGLQSCNWWIMDDTTWS